MLWIYRTFYPGTVVKNFANKIHVIIPSENPGGSRREGVRRGKGGGWWILILFVEGIKWYLYLIFSDSNLLEKKTIIKGKRWLICTTHFQSRALSRPSLFPLAWAITEPIHCSELLELLPVQSWALLCCWPVTPLVALVTAAAYSLLPALNHQHLHFPWWRHEAEFKIKEGRIKNENSLKVVTMCGGQLMSNATVALYFWILIVFLFSNDTTTTSLNNYHQLLIIR